MGNKISRHRAIVDERYTRPQGLYEHKDVDQKKLRRSILDAKLAPCYPGNEDQSLDLEECPICFLFYPSLNRSKCCCKCICTECFLQMKAAHSGRLIQCPFCKMTNFAVEYRGAKTMEEKGIEQLEEQKMIEAKIRLRQRELKEEIQRQEENSSQGRFNIQSSLMRDNFLSSPGCMSATGLMTPGTIGNYHEICPPQEDTITRTIVEPGNRLISEEEQYAAVLQGGLTSRAWTLPPPIDGSTSVYRHGGNESGSSFLRNDEFSTDLEDLMVMEAIWLSIQEQSLQWQSSLSASGGYMTTSGFIDCAVDMKLSIHDCPEDIPPFSSTDDTGVMPCSVGLASALAVLAETQIQSVENVGSAPAQAFSNIRHENSLPFLHDHVKEAERSVSMLGDVNGREDITGVSSAYAGSTRFNSHLEKDFICKEGNERNFANIIDAQQRKKED